MQIDLLIGELLLRNNCVVVPKFGGFIATQTSATIDYTSGKMLPPKKSVLFNKQLINNDGLLISKYASKFNCTYDQAVSEVETQVNSWFEVLNDGKRISIEKVGFIYLDNEKNIRFEQDRFFNLLLQSFGMSQVDFIPEVNLNLIEEKQEVKVHFDEKRIETPVITLIPEIKIPKREKVLEEKIVEIHSKKGSSKKLIKYIAAACILPIAFYSVWIPTKTDVLQSGMLSFKDFNPFQKEISSEYQKTSFKTKFTKIPVVKSLGELTQNLPEEIEVYPLEFENAELGEENDIFYVKLKESVSTKTTIDNNVTEIIPESKNVKTEITKVQKFGNSGKIKVVVGSFSNDGNANSLMNELKAKGFPAFTYPESNGLIRVVAAASNSNSEANAVVSKLNEFEISSWILK